MVKAELLKDITYNEFAKGYAGDTVYVLLRSDGVDWDSSEFYVIFSQERQEACTVDVSYVKIINDSGLEVN